MIQSNEYLESSLMAQSESITQARSELKRKMMENPIRVAMDELQLHDLSHTSAESSEHCWDAHLVMEDAA